MFTPPPSPQPSRTDGFDTSSSIPTELHNLEKFSDSWNLDDTKRRTGRRFLWAVVLIPFIVITFTVYGGFPTSLARKSAPVFSPPPHQSKWKREPMPQTAASSSSTSSASPTSTSLPAASQILPTIPSSPPTIPTPFPQAFDGIITQNFSSSSCLNFFNNMTVAMNFRSCRPFSFLSSTSSTFISAQTNLTLMNSLIWGTCNTTLSNDQCRSGMESFASQLQSDCSQELTNKNLFVVNSLTALQAYQVMHDTACLADPTTNVYCYLSAVQNTNPSDLYFYSLPLGIPLPNSATPSCSACSKSIMGIYATALQDSSQANQLSGLKSAYKISAQIAAQFCGSAFALTSISSAISLYCGWSTTLFTVSIFALTWTILALVS